MSDDIVARLRVELAAERERKDPVFLWEEIRKHNAARKAAEAERDELRALLREARGFVGYFEMTPAQHVAQKSIELGKKIDAALKGDGE